MADNQTSNEYTDADSEVSFPSLINTLRTDLITSMTKIIDGKFEKLTKTMIDFDKRLTLKENEISNLKETVSSQGNKITDLENKLDDQINRSCRSTLIISKLPEIKNENWDATANILANKLCRYSVHTEDKLSASDFLNMIERAYRTGSTSVEAEKNRNGPRPITVKFNSWKSSEMVKNLIITGNCGKNLTNTKMTEKIFVQQKFSKSLTERRNNAMKRRKEMKNDSEFTDSNIFIAYPATMMIKRPGNKTYVQHEQF